MLRTGSHTHKLLIKDLIQTFGMSCFLFVFVCYLNLYLSLIEIAWKVWNNIELKNLDLCRYRSDLHAKFIQCKLPSNPDSTNNQTVRVCELIKNMYGFSNTWPSRCNPTNFRFKLKIFATIDEKEKNVKLEYSMAQFNPKYILPIRIRRRENSFTSKVEWKLFTLLRITEERNSEKFSVFYRDFGHWRAQIFCGHMNVDWKKHDKVLQSWFSIDMQCVCLRKTGSFCGWLFYNFLLFSCKLVIVNALA